MEFLCVPHVSLDTCISHQMLRIFFQIHSTHYRHVCLWYFLDVSTTLSKNINMHSMSLIPMVYRMWCATTILSTQLHSHTDRDTLRGYFLDVSNDTIKKYAAGISSISHSDKICVCVLWTLYKSISSFTTDMKYLLCVF